MTKFVHFHVHSPFSFLDGASSLKNLVARAAEYGMPALAITDHHNVSAAVQFQQMALEAGVKPIQGAEVTLESGHHLVLIARNPKGYANLCRILTAAHLGSPRLEPRVSFAHLERYPGDLFALSGCRRGEIPSLVLRNRFQEAREAALKYRRIFENAFFLELTDSLLPGSTALNHHLADLGADLGIELVVTNNVHYVSKEEFPIHDLLTCVRTLSRVEEVYPGRRLNGENYLKSAAEMAELFRDYPDAVARTVRLAEECEPALDLGTPLFPAFPAPSGQTAASYLRRLTFEGAARRYGYLTRPIVDRLEHELNIICRLGYEDYFLLVWDVGSFARSKGIRYAGRGSAADSAVAYCLFLTEVDAFHRRLLFERFMSLERAQKPDIDLDFDARYRDQVADYLYRTYGAERVASVCTYNTFRARSAIRDLGKALDFPPDEIDRLAKKLPYVKADGIKRAMEKYPELRSSQIPWWKYERLLEACSAIAGFPRHLGTHLGGVVVSRDPITGITPLQRAAKGVVVAQFDKVDIEDLGLVKLDLLSLRTLSVVDDAARQIQVRETGFDYDRIPLDDPGVFQMLNRGESIGVFQLESPAQRALQCRLKADQPEDIVASLALIRPGPIKGNMVEPFIARRQGLEPVSYLHPKLRPILKKTYGVVLYQEQVIEIATAIANFTPGEADRLRRVMSHARSREEMEEIGQTFNRKAIANGVEPEVAATIFSYVAGYASYGFCEAHAAAFATTSLKTAYLVQNYPAEFFAAILNHQPMGYYPPHTIIVEARRCGVTILPPDVNRSAEKFIAQGNGIRVALGQVKHLSRKAIQSLLEARERGPFRSLPDFCRRVKLNRTELRLLILCGTFDSLNSNRKALLWQGENLIGEAETGEGIFAPDQMGAGESAHISPISDYTPLRKLLFEYALLGFGVKEHLIEFLRRHGRLQGIKSTKDLLSVKPGNTVRVAGIVIRPHRPPTRSGKTIVFLSLEDEFGLVDVTIFESIYHKYAGVIYQDPCPPLVITGKLEKRGEGINLIAWEVTELIGE